MLLQSRVNQPKGKGGKLVDKIFIVNVVSLHFVSNLEILTFSKVMDRHPLGVYELSYSGVVSPGGRIKPRGGGIQKCEDTMDLLPNIL